MQRFDFLKDMIGHGIAECFFPAGSVAVGKRDEILFTYTAGRLSLPDGPYADPETRYDLASMTKMFAPAMLALLAIEHGMLTLDDTLSRFFCVQEEKSSITIRQLMTHTGGFSPHFMLEQVCRDPSEAVQAILEHPLEGTPGDMPRYSCMGYILLGKILEIVYGRTLDRAAAETVFAPLGMMHTGYLPKGSNIAATEVDTRTGTAWQGIVHDENARFLGGVSGNAGVFSDIGDCVRFASMLACSGTPLLSPATLRCAIRDRTSGYSVHRGLGFHIAGNDTSFFGDLFPAASFGHSGFTGTSMAVDPETGLFAVLLTNRVHPSRESDGILRFRRIMHNRIYAAASKS